MYFEVVPSSVSCLKNKAARDSALKASGDTPDGRPNVVPSGRGSPPLVPLSTAYRTCCRANNRFAASYSVFTPSFCTHSLAPSPLEINQAGTGSSPNLHKDSFNATRSSAFYDCTSNPYSHNILITASSVFSARISMLSPTPNPCVSNATCAMRHHVLSPLAASPELKTLAKLLHSVTFISVDLSAYVTKGA